MECLTSYPPLTSVDARPRDIGRAAAELLETWLERESKAAVRIEIPPVHVVSRRSTDMFAVDGERLLKALRYIREHACDPCRVSDVAAEAGVPRRWLERRVFALFGCTPYDLILRQRLQEAEALLAETDMKLLDVAQRTGFRYESNLSRTLRQVLGLTVSRIRKGWTAVAGRRDTRCPRMPLAPLTKTGPKTVTPFGPG